MMETYAGLELIFLAIFVGIFVDEKRHHKDERDALLKENDMLHEKLGLQTAAKHNRTEAL